MLHWSFPCKNKEKVATAMPKSRMATSLYPKEKAMMSTCTNNSNAAHLVNNPNNNKNPKIVSNKLDNKIIVAGGTGRVEAHWGKYPMSSVGSTNLLMPNHRKRRARPI